MLYSTLSSYSAAFLACYVLLPFTSAHLELYQPLPMRSRFDPLNTGDQVDYNLKSPLAANGSNYPCHGYQNDRPIRTTATYTAGQSYQMSVAGTVFHGGGSCQLSLSYDNGATFKVIKSMIGGCPLAVAYNFTVPSFAPSGVALFAWTWFNEIGNREMYMNCAHVQIVGSSASRRSRTKRQSGFTSMSSLPNIWRANIAGLDHCATTEGLDMVYPEPGPIVVYGGLRTSASPVDTQQGCDTVEPLGQTYEDLGDSSASPSSLSAASALISPTPVVSPSSGGVFAEGASSNSTTSTSIPATTLSTTLLVFTTANSTVLISTETIPAAVSATTLPTTLLSSTTANSTALIATETTPTGAALTTIPTPTPTLQSSNGSASNISFASTSNTAQYLPCVPGAFLCTSQTTYLECDLASGATPFTPSSKYVGPMQVAAGMQCVPYLSKLLTPSDVQKFANTSAVPDGWYRSDRYVLL